MVRAEATRAGKRSMEKEVCMPEVMQPRQRETSRFLASTVMIVASWQLRRAWFLLLFITFGMIAAVVIACAIPLLSDVMMTAGLRSTLRATPDSAEITLNTGTEGTSTPIVENVHTTFDDLFHHSLGKSISPEQFSIISEDFSLFPSQKNTLLTVYGTSLQQAAAHLEPIQGRLLHFSFSRLFSSL